jgi:hypothetical protein
MDASINSITVGRGSGNVNTNTAVGFTTLFNNNTTGINNTAIGCQALLQNIDGSNNTAVGYQALTGNTNSFNTAIGFLALQVNTSGRENTAIGGYAGIQITTGSDNTCIGFNAQASSATVSNEITLGDGSVAALRCQVPLTVLSDARDKKYIETLDAGLQFVDKLKPVKFIWNMRNGGKKDIPEIGFIAQDLQQVQKDTGITIPNLVYESNPDKLEATYGTLLPILVKAVQELSAEVKALKTELNELKNK